MFGNKQQINCDFKCRSSSLTEQRPRSSELWNLDLTNDSDALHKTKTRILAPHSSMGRTCISINSFDNSNRSSDSIISIKIMNNLSRLRAAYKYLTPTIDDIIRQATSYSHKDFQELLSKKKPICSISYSQYIRAFEASELINQVGKDLGSQHHEPGDLLYQTDITVNTMTTMQGGREEIFQNIERLADRIFIDRELMKQLVDLHELITETIAKLKNNLDQVNIDGLMIPRDNSATVKESLKDIRTPTEIDKSLIRKQIAKNFIVVGEPKNLKCDPDEEAVLRQRDKTKKCCRELPDEIKEYIAEKQKALNQEYESKSKSNMNSPQGQTMTTYDAQIDSQMQEQGYQRSECSSKCSGMHKKRSKDSKRSKKEWPKCKESSIGCKMSRRRREKVKGEKKRQEPNTTYKNSSQNPDPERISITKPRIIDYEKISISNLKCPDVKCGRNINMDDLSPSQLDAIVVKSASFTVGVKEYDLKCRNKLGQACTTSPPENMKTIDLEPIVMADSGTAILTTPSDIQIPQTAYGSPFSPGPASISGLVSPPPAAAFGGGKSSHHYESMNTAQNTLYHPSYPLPKCSQNCQTSEVTCAKPADILKNMIGIVADQLFYLQDKLVIDVDEEDEIPTPPEDENVQQEYRTLKQVIACLKELEQIKAKLFSLNFLEVDGLIPGPVGCCYKEYAHVHANIIGIPITIKLSPTLLNLLLDKYQEQPNYKNVRVNTPHQSIQPQSTKDSKYCTCKPMSLRRLLKEKCALAKMLKMNNRNKLVVMNVDPMYEAMFDFDMVSQETVPSILSSKQNAYQERQMDVFEVLNLQESNTSLPYVVNRHSLPNITACPPMDIDVAVLRKHCRNVEIEHPKLRIQHQLQEIGFDNLLRAAMPAKCCMPVGINAVDLDSAPFHASLNSLPLTTSDLHLIADTVEEENYRLAICNYRALTSTPTFKFEYYTNFQENFTSNYDYFMSRLRTRVYLVFYFEVFKKDQQVYRGGSSSHRPSSSSYHKTVSRQFDVRSRSPSRDQHPSRSIISEFFRKFMFNSDQVVTQEMPDSSYSDDECELTERGHQKRFEKEKRHSRKSRHDETSNEPLPKERNRSLGRKKKSAKNSESTKLVKNRKLQANFAELDYYIQPPEEGILADPYQFDKISSSIKNYTVSTMTCTKTKVKYPQEPHQIQRGHDSRASSQRINEQSISTSCNKTVKSSRTRSMVNAGVQHNIRRKSAPSKPQISINKKTQHHRPLDEDSSDISLSPLSVSDTNEPPECDFANRREQKLEKPVRSKHGTKMEKITPSVKNLGTIYESDEKLPSKECKLPNSPYSSFYEFLKMPEVSKSFQRFIINEKSTEKLTPEQFWQLYLKSKYETQHSVSKSVSMSSTVDDTELKSEAIELPSQKSKTFSKLQSKIPRRTKSYTDSSSEISSVAKTSRPKCYHKVPSVPSSIASKKPVRKETCKETKVYYSEVRDEAKVQPNKIVSMQSLQVLAGKNGPGYITVLHPVCGCPEVSIFIPCYCDENGRECNRHNCSLSPKRITHLTENRDGRHIVLPSTCRIPRLTDEYKTKKFQYNRES